MSFPYSTLGNQCESQTHALTSNAKWIIPLSPVYYKRFTPMMYYPGYDANKLYKEPVTQTRQNETRCVGCGK